MRKLLVLAAALIGCALVLRFGPLAAEAGVHLLGGERLQSAAAIETVYASVIFGGLLLIAIAGGRWCGVNPFQIGRRPTALFGAGLAVGSVGAAVAVLMAWVAGAVEGGSAPASRPGLLLWGSAVVLFAATAEEVYFRGWLQPALARDIGVPAAVLLSALAFAALHVMGGARSPTALVNLFLGGLLFGILAMRGPGLAAAVGAHVAWNWTEQIGLGLDPNPGVGSFGGLVDLDLRGAGRWSSAAEGLNGGVAMTVALLALLVPLVILGRASFVRQAGTVDTNRPEGEGAWSRR